MGTQKKANRLIREKSPYLQQHALNPVDWYPWSAEAFERARLETKPIFLSIGYSTCHWCHVMERESFENPEIADIMNRWFVSIKVDREERPDVDKVYMTALQGMGQNGGWPLSMFLTPELRPFYGGTYFPPDSRYGRLGFPDLLCRIHEIWENQREKALDSAAGIVSFLEKVPSSLKPVEIDSDGLRICFSQLSRSYDAEFGGFGGAPKFPRPVVFGFLLRHFLNTGNTEALVMCSHTLRKMREGGVYDQVGGGFHRYSVDGEWRVPHFEKMLYDQALIASTLIDAFRVTKDDFFARAAREVLDYILRDLQHTWGAFFSAEDADSPREGTPGEVGEGAFYVWTMKELMEALGERDGLLFCFHCGVEAAGNVPFDPQHEFTGRNILYVAHSLGDTAAAFGVTEGEAAEALARAREKLFALRVRRPRPPRDEKILTSWNGLAISALARAAEALDDRRYLEAAEKAAGFILRELYHPERRELFRRFMDGESKHEGQLDDYAFLVQGLIDLYEAAFDIAWLEHAVELTGRQIDLFWDPAGGGFFDTSGRDPSILVRMKEYYDGAEPSGNSVAALNLARLAEMTDNGEWRSKARQCISLFGETLRRQPIIMPQMLAAVDFVSQKTTQIVLAGERGKPDCERMRRVIYDRYLPNRIVLYADGAEQQEKLSRHLPFMREVKMVDGKATAYVCEDYSCKVPTSDVQETEKLLSGGT